MERIHGFFGMPLDESDSITAALGLLGREGLTAASTEDGLNVEVPKSHIR